MASENNVGHLIIPQDKVPAAAYQAIYHKLTSKIEKLHEVFDEAYEIEVRDIAQLDSMLCQIIRQYPTESQSSKCAISFRKDERIEVSSIEKFRLLNLTTNKPTEAIEYTFDFYTILPVEIKEAEDIVQRFKVTLKVDQDFVEEGDDMPFYVVGMMSGKNIRMTIEYSDYAVGRTLQTCVQDWVDALPSKRVPLVIKFLEKRADFFHVFVPYLFASASLYGASKFEVQNLQNMTQIIMIGISVAILMFVVARILIILFYKELNQSKPLTFIKLTNGDKVRSQKIILARGKKYAALAFISASICLGIIVNLFSAWLWAKL